MRDTALSWASELIEKNQWKIQLDNFLVLFRKRFSNLYKTEISLSNFLTSASPTTREEFTDLLNAGTILYEQQLMNTGALAQVLIGKCPDNIKSLLFQSMEQANDWHGFIQRAEQVAWLAFPNKTLNRVSTSGTNQNFYRSMNNNYSQQSKNQTNQKFTTGHKNNYQKNRKFSVNFMVKEDMRYRGGRVNNP